MIIDIIGAGALGLLFGTKLQAVRHQVRLWTRTEEQSNQLRAQGIRTLESGGAVHVLSPENVQALPISGLLDEWNRAPGDWLFLMVKQTGMDEAIQSMDGLKTKPVNAVCFQNGLGHIEKLEKAFPSWRIFSAVTTEGAKRDGGDVHRAGHGQTWIGESKDARGNQSANVGRSSAADVALMLCQAGFDGIASNQIERMVHRKWMINAVINPLTALWRIPNGELLSREERIAVMRQLYDEGMNILAAAGIETDPDWWEQILSVCRSTASNTSSMLADVQSGRRTEIESINGQFVILAHRCGLPAPMHETMYRLIEGM